MYNYIKGKITVIQPEYIVVENNNIGYQIKTPNPQNFKLNDDVTIYTYLLVREEVFELYGFNDLLTKDLFLKLISVKGIGPKIACAILAKDSIASLIDAIEQGDSKYLQKIPGVGAKASQQIILDLHGKIKIEDTKTEVNPKVSDTILALKSLGYNQSEIKSITKLLEENSNLSVSDLVKLALKNIRK